MASHNNTPESVLNAPEATKAFVEGTEFSGVNRERRRAQRKTPPHILRETARSARFVAAVIARKAARAERARKRLARRAKQ